MPMIRVEMFKGRSVEQKREVARSLTDAFVAATGATPESVQIVFTDVEKSDWAKAGALFSDTIPD